MNKKDVFQGKWKQLRGRIQQRWGKLTDDELERVKGARAEFEGLLQERYGYSEERARQEVDDLVQKT